MKMYEYGGKTSPALTKVLEEHEWSTSCPGHYTLWVFQKVSQAGKENGKQEEGGKNLLESITRTSSLIRRHMNKGTNVTELKSCQDERSYYCCGMCNQPLVFCL
jgi:hypothetical protein